MRTRRHRLDHGLTDGLRCFVEVRSSMGTSSGLNQRSMRRPCEPLNVTQRPPGTREMPAKAVRSPAGSTPASRCETTDTSRSPDASPSASRTEGSGANPRRSPAVPSRAVVGRKHRVLVRAPRPPIPPRERKVAARPFKPCGPSSSSTAARSSTPEMANGQPCRYRPGELRRFERPNQSASSAFDELRCPDLVDVATECDAAKATNMYLSHTPRLRAALRRWDGSAPAGSNSPTMPLTPGRIFVRGGRAQPSHPTNADLVAPLPVARLLPYHVRAPGLFPRGTRRSRTP